jgi:ABC-type transport system substrate-binding protein
MKRNLNRRDFMKVAGLAGLGIAAVACQPAQTTPEATEVMLDPTNTAPAIQVSEATSTPVPTVEGVQYKQAPMLDSMDLPPVEERISANPLVTAPREAIGKYGGTLRCVTWWPEAGNIQLYISEPPIKWKEDLTGYEPALAEGYEWSDDGLTFTLHMRKGVRWSDGEPYTSADWQFYWEDIAKNEDFKTISVPAYMRKSDGTPIDMEFPDEYTVVWKSDVAQWIAPYYLAQGFWEFANNKMMPAHFLKAYHPTYDSTKTYEDLQNINKYWQTPGYPTVLAYYCSAVSDDGTKYTWTRNPYYWRVDTEGNQLPYIDEYLIEIVADEQARILAITSGKYDISFRGGGSPNDLPLFIEKAADGGYRMLEGWMNGAGAWPGYMVNQYYVEGGKYYTDDTPEHAAEIRELLRDKRFRKALSWGIDRNRLIDVAWNGIGEAKAATLSPQSWHFSSPEGQEVYKNWAAADAQLDVEAANAALDEIGMTVGADGFRQLPSGKAFTLVMMVTDWGGSLKVQTDAAAEAKTLWETNLKIKVEIQNLQGQPNVDTLTNEGQYMIRGCHVSEIDIMTYPDWLFPVVNRYYMPLEGRYYAKGKDTCTADPAIPYDCGVMPEAGSPAEKLQALYFDASQTKSIEDRHKIVWDAVQINIDEGPFIIGISGDQQMCVIANTKLRNILDYGVVGPWAPDTPGNQVVSQWFYE